MEALGINLVNIIIYSILFFVVYLLLNKYLLKTLVTTIEKRKNDIKENLELKDKLGKEAEAMEESKKKIEADAREEGKKSVGVVINEAKAEKKQILDAAKKEADAIVTKANERLDQERKKMEQEFQDKVEVAVRKVLKEYYQQDKPELDKKLIEVALKEL